MKKTAEKWMVMALMSFIAIATTATAQNLVEIQAAPTTMVSGNVIVAPTAVLPVKSQDQLRLAALGMGVRGFRAVSATTMVSDHPYVEASGVGGGVEALLDELFSKEIVYSLANSQDTVTGRVWIYDVNNILIYYGVADYKIAEIGAGGPQYRIWMQPTPLLDGVQSAVVLVVGEGGATANEIQLEVTLGGQLLFQPWLCGAPNGILFVRFTNGSVATFPLANPEQNNPSATGEKANWKIEGHYVYGPAPEDITVKITEVWSLPTLLIKITVPGQKVLLDVTGLVQDGGIPFFEKPKSVFMTRADGSWLGAESPMNLSGVTELSFPGIGDYRLRFSWEKFGKPGMLYAGPIAIPVDGGGGGKGSTEPELK